MTVAETNETVRYKITIAGSELTQTDPKGLEYIEIEDSIDRIGMARLSFNREGEFDWTSIVVGDEIEVEMGGGTRKWKGYIIGSRYYWRQAKETMTVIALDPLCKLAASKVTKVYEGVTDSDVASQVISAAGVSAGKVDATSDTHDHILQRNESDLTFLRRLAARNGYLLMCSEGDVDFCKPQTSAPAVEVAKDELISLDFTGNSQGVVSSVEVYGWDYVNKVEVTGTAAASDVETTGDGDNAAEGAANIWAGPMVISDVMVTSDAAAKEMAIAEINRASRTYLRGTARVQGRNDLFAGSKVKFSDLPTGANAEGSVTSVRHIVEPTTGYTSEVTFVSNCVPG